MKTIQANVSRRLLTKASRLFTGTQQGRIIEVLQNARRAGATQVEITNTPAPGIPGHPDTTATVTVHDNGAGIQDFAKLLDLGASGWAPGAALEDSEDPAGVGLFCLAPRAVTVRSRGHIAVIHEQGWTGARVEVRIDPKPVKGTLLQFQDEPWNAGAVESLAVFTGLKVTVDGEPCPRAKFLTGKAAHFRGLGCRVQVITKDMLSNWCRAAAGCDYHVNVLVNFHGQVVGFDYRPISVEGLVFLVDLTGEPTGIRLMLPARTQLVQNEALDQLRGALEREAFLYVQRQGKHTLPFREYLRAKELGIDLPEAEPTFQVGLLYNDMAPEPIPVVMPEGHLLSQCYQLKNDRPDGDDADEANAHLLAALATPGIAGTPGASGRPFVPVSIRGVYDGYSWAKLPTVDKVELSVGKTLLQDWVGSGQLICVDALAITARTSDGKVFSAPVSMAIKPGEKPTKAGLPCYRDDEVYVTPQARQHQADHVWYHLGGYSDDGDTYDTQEYHFAQELDRFWARLLGPDEPLRAKLLDCLSGLNVKWRSVTIRADGRVTIHRRNGKTKVIAPPRAGSR